MVRFEPLVMRHLEAVADLVSDPEVLRFTRVPDHPGPDYARRWIERYEDGRRDGGREGFAALDGDGAFPGMALAPHVRREDREAEPGYIVVTSARGRGVATEMLRHLTDWALGSAQLLRVHLLIDVANTAFERVAARCGYVREGVLRSVHLKDGRRADTAAWPRLPTDPAITP
jgi:RimJ/RimL family protein N-acetyltransferase